MDLFIPIMVAGLLDPDYDIRGRSLLIVMKLEIVPHRSQEQ